MTTWTYQTKIGAGWLYNQTGINYDSSEDPESGEPLKYDSLGTPTTWTNESRN
jgi:hypothetical protein